MLDKIVGVYIKPEQTMAEEAKKEHNKAFLVAHTFFNAFILNSFVAAVFLEVPVLAIFFFLVLSAVTAIAILAIEFVTHKAAASKGGKGTYWSQLAITNLYLTPVFLAFVVIAVVAILVFPTSNARMPLDLFVGIMASRMNTKKILAVHAVKDSLVDIVYGVGMIAAYILWCAIIIAPAVLLGAFGA